MTLRFPNRRPDLEEHGPLNFNDDDLVAEMQGRWREMTVVLLQRVVGIVTVIVMAWAIWGAEAAGLASGIMLYVDGTVARGRMQG